MNIKILAIGFLLWVLFFVVDLVRRNQLTFRYAAGWILLSAFGILLVGFQQPIFLLAEFFGFKLPSNFIFFCAVVSGVLMSLFLTIFLCQQNSRNDRMAQKISLLENELQKLNQKITEKG